MTTASASDLTYGVALLIDDQGGLVPTPLRVDGERFRRCDEDEYVASGHRTVPGYLSLRLLAGLPGIDAGSTSAFLVSGYLLHRVSAELTSGSFQPTDSAPLGAPTPSDGVSVATYPEGETPPPRGVGERGSTATKGGHARCARDLGIDGPSPTHPSPESHGGSQ